jgi:6-hydroxynicotinate reductase
VDSHSYTNNIIENDEREQGGRSAIVFDQISPINREQDMVTQPVANTVNGKIRCDACPVMCYIADGKSGACDRYANNGGDLVRVDPFTVIEKTASHGGKIVPFLPDDKADWDGDIVHAGSTFITAVGAGTTYPDYKPAPFIVSQKQNGVDMVTVVTEGIFSYCGAKVKIDTDRFIGPETALVRVDGEAVGHVTTGEYGSQMLSLGGVHHLTGGSKKEGRVTCDTLMRLCNGEQLEMVVDGGATLLLKAGAAPVINGTLEERMRVGCGSATIGIFARQWKDMVDEVVVVDDHITGVLSEHQAGKLLDIAPTGIKIKGRRSTPGRYFQVAEPGTGWGGTNISDPLAILGDFDPKVAYPGLRLLMVSTTGEQYGYYVLDNQLRPIKQEILPSAVEETVAIVAENCEPAMVSVLFMGGAGGSLRAGVTTNPVRLTNSVRQALTNVTCGGAPAYLWPGGGITVMADVTQMPSNSFGYVPTPAIVAPIEFTMRLEDYRALGGHMEAIVPLEQALEQAERRIGLQNDAPWPMDETNFRWGA